MLYLVSFSLLLSTLFFPQPIFANCSLKKGIGGPGGCPDVPQLNQLLKQIDVSWFYTWHYCPNKDSYWNTDAEYVPMIRGIHPYNRSQIKKIIDQRNHRGKYWLIGNEPDRPDQDNLTPSQAAQKYGEIAYMIKEIDPTAKLIMLGLSYPNKSWWKNEFVAAWNGKWPSPQYATLNQTVTGWNIHTYAHPWNNETQEQATDRIKRHLNDWITNNHLNNNYELWVTEFGNFQQSDPNTMTNLTNFLETNSNIDRYAYFYFGESSGSWGGISLYNTYPQWPSITSLGSLYTSLPSNPQSSCVTLPSPTRTPTPTLPPPTATPTTSPPVTTNTTTPTNTPVPNNCSVLQGTLIEAELWRTNYIAGKTGTIKRNDWSTDFVGATDGNCDGFVDIDDFEAWRAEYMLNMLNL